MSEQDGIEDWSWDMIWDSRGRVTDDGYVVELALPFNQLRFPSAAGAQTWGFEASRSWPRSVRHRMNSHWRDRNKGCVLCEENKIVGLEGLEPGRNLEIDPTVTGTQTGEREPFPSGDFDDHRDAEAGVTLRWGITPNLTLSGTANPDFSQVEADVAQLDVNQRFALFYPEKRPFFLEGIDFFATPLQVVFTRTVVDPYGGAKLTGKVGRNALGVFTAVDSLNNLVFPSNQGSDFGRRRVAETAGIAGDFRPQFEVEGYLEHQAHRFADTFDANSYLYLSRAMDQFDLAEHGRGSLAAAFARIRVQRALVLGVETDMLFPIEQQREIADQLRAAGRAEVEFHAFPSMQGHDAFLVDLPRFEPAIGGFLERVSTGRG